METDYGRIDPIRKESGPILEHVIDEYLGDRITRRDFIRRATMFGMSVPVVGSIIAARGGLLERPERSLAARGATSPRTAAASGGTINAGFIIPATGAQPDPRSKTRAAWKMLGNIGEFLVFSDQKLVYHPWLATSWSSNADASVWTFKIRQGVKFNNGKPMTVDDVVYSFKSQCEHGDRRQRSVGLRWHAQPRRSREGRRPSRSLPSRGAGRELRRRLLRRQLQHDHRPERLRLQQLPQGGPASSARTSSRSRPSHPNPAAPSSATRTTGAHRRSRARSWSPSTPTSSRWPRPSRPGRSTSWTSSPSPSARSCSTGTGT